MVKKISDALLNNTSSSNFGQIICKVKDLQYLNLLLSGNFSSNISNTVKITNIKDNTLSITCMNVADAHSVKFSEQDIINFFNNKQPNSSIKKLKIIIK